MEMVTLKNGSEEAKPLVVIVMMSLRKLFNSGNMGDAISAYELAMKAREPGHKLFGNTVQDLAKLALVNADGSMHDSVRNIVVSAVEGEGFDMTLGNPVKQGPRPGL